MDCALGLGEAQLLLLCLVAIGPVGVLLLRGHEGRRSEGGNPACLPAASRARAWVRPAFPLRTSLYLPQCRC
eukprot:8026886-Pyramimonas_sp.AAC.1